VIFPGLPWPLRRHFHWNKPPENNCPMMFARIGMMQAINRHKPVEFDPSHKAPIGETEA
jgi:hypothetical protein